MLISIQAGNSDNKLTQQEWAEFIVELGSLVRAYATALHFFGGSETYARWQNVCWVAEIPSGCFDELVSDIVQIRKLHRQDSVCILAGEALFV